MDFIAERVAEACSKSPDSLGIRSLKQALRETDAAIESLWRALESGQAAEMITARLQMRQKEKEELEAQLAVEQNRHLTLTKPQVRAFLDYVRSLPSDDVAKRRAIINIFVHSVYLYDDHFTLIINASKKPLRKEDIPLDDIENALDHTDCDIINAGSSTKTSAPPGQDHYFYKKIVILFLCFETVDNTGFSLILVRRGREKV